MGWFKSALINQYITWEIMELLYFGVNPLVWLVLSVVLFVFSIFVVWKKVINNKEKPKFWVIFSAVVFGASLFCQYARSDLGKNITERQAAKLHGSYKESFSSASGYEFRKALDDLLSEKGVLVYGDLSYIGSDIYAEHITKSEWNRLAKIQSENEEQ